MIRSRCSAIQQRVGRWQPNSHQSEGGRRSESGHQKERQAADSCRGKEAGPPQPLAWPLRRRLNGRYTFRDSGQVIDLDAIVAGLNLT
jgi:hypothetical protein